MPFEYQNAPNSPSVIFEMQRGTSVYSDISRLLVEAQAVLARDPDKAMQCIALASTILAGQKNRDQIESDAGTASSLARGLAAWQVKQLRSFIEANLPFPISLQELAELSRLSLSHFARPFKISFGEPPHAYIVRRRIERARHLMLTTSEPLAQIALDCGLADQSHFTRLFRRFIGTSPHAWRRKRTDGPAE